jgi:hypothetical protein
MQIDLYHGKQLCFKVKRLVIDKTQTKQVLLALFSIQIT